MLTGGTDTLYRNTLAAGHEQMVRIDVFDGVGTFLKTLERSSSDTVIDPNRSILSGSVTATLTSRVARTCTFTVHQDLYPVLNTDLLAPYGNFIRAYRGVRLSDGNEKYTWQVFEGRIQNSRLTSSGTVTVSCSDRASDVIDNGFISPTNSTVGKDCVEQIKDLIGDGFPGATFGTSDVFGLTMPRLTWESDRGSALDEIAQSLGAYWYPLANAQFVVRRIPWTVAGAPVVTFNDGEGGTILDYGVERDRTNVYNVIAATGERTDGTAPVFAVSRDNNPSSPTYYLGQFGQRTRNIHLQTPASSGAVQSVADDVLKSSKALTESWDLVIVPDASLELGDVIGIEAADRTGIIQVVSGFALPLDLVSGMSLTLRSQVIGLLEDVS